jgi:hypothetical protein
MGVGTNGSRTHRGRMEFPKLNGTPDRSYASSSLYRINQKTKSKSGERRKKLEGASKLQPCKRVLGEEKGARSTKRDNSMSFPYWSQKLRRLRMLVNLRCACHQLLLNQPIVTLTRIKAAIAAAAIPTATATRRSTTSTVRMFFSMPKVPGPRCAGI